MAVYKHAVWYTMAIPTCCSFGPNLERIGWMMEGWEVRRVLWLTGMFLWFCASISHGENSSERVDDDDDDDGSWGRDEICGFFSERGE